MKTGGLEVVEGYKIIVSGESMNRADANFVKALEEILLVFSAVCMHVQGIAYLSNVDGILDFLRP